MFIQLDQILESCSELNLKICRGPTGTIKVFVMPSAKTPAEKALATPLMMCGTPAELDAEFIGHLDAYRASRSSLGEQVQATKEAHDKAAAAQKAAASVKQKPNAPAMRTDDENEDEDESGAVPPGVVAATGAGSGTDLTILLGDD